MDDSDCEYQPSLEEEIVIITASPREKSLRKSLYPFNCKKCDERFFFIWRILKILQKSLLIYQKHPLHQNMSALSAWRTSHPCLTFQDIWRYSMKLHHKKTIRSQQRKWDWNASAVQAPSHFFFKSRKTHGQDSLN